MSGQVLESQPNNSFKPNPHQVRYLRVVLGTIGFGANPWRVGLIQALGRFYLMDYQLVLQIAGDSLLDYDVMIEVEGGLIEAIGDAGKVDGHDIGSGESNIFILTSRPEAAFLRAKTALEDLGLIDQVRAACRLTAGEVYTVVWPADSRIPFVVA